jgi:hypothetical protein
MEAGSIVRGGPGGCLCTPLNPMSTGGASSLYDGAPLVEQSVARVCTSSDPDHFSTLLAMGIIHREHQCCLCP